MTAKNLLFLIIYIVWGTALHADPMDSLVADFDKSPKPETANKFLKSLHKGGLLDEEPNFTADTPTDTLCQQMWYWAAEYYYAAQDYDQSVEYAQKALPLIPEGSSLEADCQNLLAITHIRLGHYSKAATYAHRCYELDKESGDKSRISSSLNTLAGIYLGARQPQEAEKYVLRGIDLAKKADNPIRLAVLEGMASEVYHALGNDSLALHYIDEAYRLDSIGERTDRVYTRLAQKASVLNGLHRYTEAETILNRVIPYLRKIGDLHSLGISLNKMGMALLSQQREAEAIPYYREAAEIFQKQGDPYNEIHARRGLYEAQWKNNPEEARIQLARFNDLKDSIYTHASAECLARFNAEYGNDWLTLENHAERQGKQLAIAIALLIAALAVAITLWLHFRNRRQVQLNEKLRGILEELKSEGQGTDSPEREDDEKPDFMKDMSAIINEQISTGRLDVKTIASRMAMSPYKFRTELAKYTDESAQNLIQRIRMERACHLLRSRRELTIQEVAYLCGFSETANFTRTFKKSTGMTPTAYQSAKEEADS
ncbi:MAG: tetratricopeptide repeat protein [Bacteroidaceae bacterium]|nr:tetratricopeptide repeat protein [Bacteroidaceae bacterium]MBR1789251.1 tetratricopeptide repeat protein [Bacteroidaceae bacterium]